MEKNWRTEEPWISVYGALYEVQNYGVDINKALGWIRDYVERNHQKIWPVDITSSIPTITVKPPLEK